MVLLTIIIHKPTTRFDITFNEVLLSSTNGVLLSSTNGEKINYTGNLSVETVIWTFEPVLQRIRAYQGSRFLIEFTDIIPITFCWLEC